MTSAVHQTCLTRAACGGWNTDYIDPLSDAPYRSRLSPGRNRQAMEQLLPGRQKSSTSAAAILPAGIAQAQELARSRHFLACVREQSLCTICWSELSNWKQIPARQGLRHRYHSLESPRSSRLPGGALKHTRAGSPSRRGRESEPATSLPNPAPEPKEQSCRRHQPAPAGRGSGFGLLTINRRTASHYGTTPTMAIDQRELQSLGTRD